MKRTILAPNTSYRDDVLTSGQGTFSRLQAVSQITMTSGVLRISYFTSSKTETVNNIRFGSGTTAAGATPTLIRVGLFTVATNGDLTLAAGTTSDTTLFGATNTNYTRALSTGVALTAGVRYAAGLLVVTGATAPTMWGVSPTTASESAVAPRFCAALTAQTDLPSSITSGSLTASNAAPYIVLTP